MHLYGQSQRLDRGRQFDADRLRAVAERSLPGEAVRVDLQFRESIGFEDIEHNGQLCKDDYVVTRGDAPYRTPITAVRALTPDQATQIIAAAKAAGTSKK
jgi:hypothetical protein